MQYSEQLEIWTGWVLGIITWSWKNYHGVSQMGQTRIFWCIFDFFVHISKTALMISMKFCVWTVLIDTKHFEKTACRKKIWLGLYSSRQTPFLRLNRFFDFFVWYHIWQSDAVVSTTWTLDRMCARYCYLKLTNFFSKNVFLIFFKKKMFFQKKISQILIFKKFFWKIIFCQEIFLILLFKNHFWPKTFLLLLR